MRPQHDIDFTTLAWVKGELDETLKQARQALEAYVEDTSDVSQMRFCATYLHQVQGTLRMVELYGAAMVTEEMEHLAGALLDGRVAERDEAYGVLMRGIMQLPDYLERLQSGHKDIPIVLLPLLNDLRAARGEKGLTEIALFTPNLGRELPATARGPAQPLPEAELRSRAEPLRSQFQLALLKWFRNDDVDGNLTRLSDTLDRLIAQTHELEARRLFWVAAGVLEALRAKAFEPSLQLKQTIGKVEREIKRLADSGERSFRADPPHELTRNLLYFVAHAPTQHGRIGEMRAVFGLNELLPSEAEVEHARSSLSGHNRSLLDTVAGAIKDDLLRVKDALDLHLRNPGAEAAQLSSQVEVLERVSDTLGMLGLGVARRVVQEQRDAVRAVIDGSRGADESALLDIAGALLYVEASLDDQVEHLGGAGMEASTDVGHRLPAVETRRVMQALVKEAQVNFSRAKECFVGYIESSWDAQQLDAAPELLSQVAGVLRIVELLEPAGYLDAIAQFTRRELLEKRLVPDVAQMETLADALASLEYFLEGQAEQRSSRDRILLTTHASLEKLGYWPIPAEQVESAAPAAVEVPVPTAAIEPQPEPQSEASLVASDVATPVEVVRAEPEVTAAPIPEAVEPIDLTVASFEAPPASDAAAIEEPAAIESAAIEAAAIDAAAEVPDEAPAAATVEAHIPEPAAQEVEAREEGPITGGFEATSEEIDEEIREVFVEEVEEEIENLGQLLTPWLQTPTDLDQLKGIRRVFHTLKGSGRLVGALTLGEFAWRVENMLNRVLDHTIAPTPAVTALIEVAHGVLPEIHAALRGERSVRTDLEAIKDVADRLAAGEQAYYVPAAPAAKPEALEVPVAVAPVVAEPEAAPADEIAMPDQTQVAEAVEDALAEVPEIIAPEPAEIAVEVPDNRIEVPAIDPVLFDILKPEVSGHLDTIDAWLAQPGTPLDEAVVRAAHTMNGAFAMTDLPLVTEITSPLEHYLKRALAHGLTPTESGHQALVESVAALRRVVSELEAQPPRLSPLAEVAERLCVERDLLPDTPSPFVQPAAHEETITAPDLSVAVSLAPWTTDEQEAAPQPESVEPVEMVEATAVDLEDALVDLDAQPDLTSAVSIPLVEESATSDTADTAAGDVGVVEELALPQEAAAEAELPSESEVLETESIEWTEADAFAAGLVEPEALTANLTVVEIDVSDIEPTEVVAPEAPEAEAIDWTQIASFEAPVSEPEPAVVSADALDGLEFELPSVEEAAIEAEPIQEWSAAEQLEPTLEASAPDAPSLVEPTVEAPAAEEPSTEEPSTEEPSTEEPSEMDALILQWLEDEAAQVAAASTSALVEPTVEVSAIAPDQPQEVDVDVGGTVSADAFVDSLLEEDLAAAPDAEQPEAQSFDVDVATAQAPEFVDAPMAAEVDEAESIVADAPEISEAVIDEAVAESLPETLEPVAADGWNADAEPGEAPAVASADAEETTSATDFEAEFEAETETAIDEFTAALVDEPLWQAAESPESENVLPPVAETAAPAARVDVAAAAVDPRQAQLAAWFVAGLDASDPDPEQPLSIPDMDEELLDIFGEEATDILDHSDGLMARLREAPEDREVVVALQRDLHTLKGGARMAGLHAIGDLGHVMESLLEIVAEGRRQLPRYGMDVLELAFDRLNRMTARVAARQDLAVPALLVQRVDMLARGEEPELELPEIVDQAASAQVAEPEVVTAPVDVPVAAPAAAAKAIEEAAAPVELAPTALDDEDISVRAPQEQIRIRADLLDRLVNYAGEVAIYRARLEQQLGLFRTNLAEMEQTNERLRGQLRKLEIETEAQIVARYQREAEAGGKEAFDPLELDRFSTLQQLSRALSESAADLVNLQGTLEDHTRQYETLLLQQSRVSSDLQEGLMRTRMVPFDSLVPRMRRIIRQTASELGKKAQLRVEGAQGEMDRSVLDRMTAPLEHMLRNGLAHGLETPDERRALGKPEEGSIRIAVLREGSEVVIKVSDDGRGLDRDAIRRKAIDRGLLSPDASISDQALYAFILESGFSTAATVSKIAGRGVGMDVVHSEIRQLGGSLTIESERGKGSVFTVRLPFTLAVTQAVFVQQGDTSYAVPIASVQGVARIDRSELDAQLASGSPRFVYAGEDYAIHDLGRLLGHASSRAEGSLQVPLLLARSGDQRAAICVDHVIGSREIVVKPVGAQVSSIPGIFGATIMGDGRVIVILDVAPLVRRYAALHAEGVVVEAAPAAPVSRVPLVMVVDDSITMRKVTGRVLERHGYEVMTAKDGVDAIEKLTDRVPDVMLLDIEMPRMDGYELATHIRNDVRLRGIPIIMITSRTGEKHRQRAFEIGVDRYLGKPYQEADLMRNVDEILKVQRGDRG